MDHIKALAIDLDGTLLVGESLSDRNRDAVRKAFDAGLRIVIATARWRHMAESIAGQIGLDDMPVIACSGAQVYSRRAGRDIFDTRLPAAFVDQLFDICNSHRCIATATLDDHSWLKVDREPPAEYLGDGLRWVQELPASDELPRIATVQGSETIAMVRELQSADYVDSVSIYDSIGPTGKTVITITSSQANKGIALTEACRYLDIAPGQVLTFGDAGNDIEMFRVAGESVAMGQADEAVKSAADHVTLSNDADGVAVFIEEHLL